MTFRLQWPTKSRYITQNFLANYDYYMRWQLPGHEGLDIGTKLGDEIFACADGVVSFVQRDPKAHNYGIHVRIQHKTSEGIYKTTYAHLQDARVEAGDKVKGGDLIGHAGITGNTTGPHLHLTLKKIGASKAGESRFMNERGQVVEMPNDIIDPTPFLDPQPKNISVRPVLENHPSSPLLGGKTPYIPTQTATDLVATQPIAIRLPETVMLEFAHAEGVSRYQLGKGAMITVNMPPPQIGDPQLIPQENGRSYDLILGDNAKITFYGMLPWLGEALQVDSSIGLRVRANPTTSAKELVRLTDKTPLVVTSSAREGGMYLWRQIVEPETYAGVEIKGAWVAERTIDGTVVYLVPKSLEG